MKRLETMTREIQNSLSHLRGTVLVAEFALRQQLDGPTPEDFCFRLEAGERDIKESALVIRICFEDDCVEVRGPLQ